MMAEQYVNWNPLDSSGPNHAVQKAQEQQRLAGQQGLQGDDQATGSRPLTHLGKERPKKPPTRPPTRIKQSPLILEKSEPGMSDEFDTFFSKQPGTKLENKPNHAVQKVQEQQRLASQQGLQGDDQAAGSRPLTHLGKQRPKKPPTRPPTRIKQSPLILEKSEPGMSDEFDTVFSKQPGTKPENKFKQYFEENPEVGKQQHHATTGDTQRPTRKPQPPEQRRNQTHASLHGGQENVQEQQHHATTGDMQQTPNKGSQLQTAGLQGVPGDAEQKKYWNEMWEPFEEFDQYIKTEWEQPPVKPQLKKTGWYGNMKLKWAKLGQGTKCMIIFIAVIVAFGLLWGTVHVTTYFLCKNGTITDKDYCAAIGWSGGSQVTQKLAQGQSSIPGNVRSTTTTQPLQTTGSPVENPYCDGYPCANGGTCHLIDDDGYRCECTEEYTGETCDTEIEITSTVATKKEIKKHTPRVAATVRSFSMHSIKFALIISLLICAVALMFMCFVMRRKNRPQTLA